MTKQHGLCAADFLLLAKGHLVRAREELVQAHPSHAVYHARRNTQEAANLVRRALKILEAEKEETCNKP